MGFAETLDLVAPGNASGRRMEITVTVRYDFDAHIDPAELRAHGFQLEDEVPISVKS